MAAFYFVAVLMLFPFASNAEEIKVKPGDNVTLQCQSPGDATLKALKWSRPNLKKDEYVFFLRENRPYKHWQHPSFHGRVQLRDPEMKNGDVSVILKNVNINDTGTYQCCVSVKLLNTIKLKVEDSGHTAGNIWAGGDKDGGDKDGGDKDGRDQIAGDKDAGDMSGRYGLVAVAGVIVVVGFVIFIIYKRKMIPSLPHDEEAGDQQMSEM